MLNSGLGVLFLLAAAIVLVIKRDMVLDVLAQMPELASSLPVFLALAIGGMLGMTLFTPSSVSLEGKNLWILQSMPVSGAQVLRAKLRMADLLTLPAAVIASVCCVCVTELSPLILTAINALGIGPQGFGGKTTCLGLAIEQMPTHVAGLPVAVNVSCHVTRRASAEL